MLFEDRENKANAAEAFELAKLSADAHNGFGEELLGRFYLDGFGTPRNPALGKSWMDKGEAQVKLADAQAQEARVGAAVIFGALIFGALISEGSYAGNDSSDSSDDVSKQEYRRLTEQCNGGETYACRQLGRSTPNHDPDDQ